MTEDAMEVPAARSIGWQHELQRVEELCAVPNMTATRLFRILEHAQAPAYFDRRKEPANELLSARANEWRFRSGIGLFRVAPIDNRYAVVPTFVNNEVIVPIVADAIDDTTDAVVELGCAYGRHLFALRDLLEHRFPNLKYFGGDVWDEGRAAATRIAALEPWRTKVEFHHFNHLEPVLDFLPRCENVVFFTCHSIEQVKHVGQRLFHAMLAAAPHVRCIHGEPVGWQLQANVMADIVSGCFASNRPEYNHLKLFSQIDSYRSAVTPYLCGWNEDLMARLGDLQNTGHLRIEQLAVNSAGNNSYNPTTMVEWVKL